MRIKRRGRNDNLKGYNPTGGCGTRRDARSVLFWVAERTHDTDDAYYFAWAADDSPALLWERAWERAIPHWVSAFW